MVVSVGQLIGQRHVARAELEGLDRAAVHAQEVGDQAGEEGLAGCRARRGDDEERGPRPRVRVGGIVPCRSSPMAASTDWLWLVATFAVSAGCSAIIPAARARPTP